MSPLTVDQFKSLLELKSDAEIVDEVLLSPGAAHINEASILHIRKRLQEVFLVENGDVTVHVVGSAKLGFSLIEKQVSGKHLPRFRAFGLASDVDVAVISGPIFDAIWGELSTHAFASAWRLPWDSGKLGDYLVHGWLRPDYFPRVRRCDNWWDLFRRLSVDARFDRHRVRGGLFYSLDHLRQYQQLGVADCRRGLELTG